MKGTFRTLALQESIYSVNNHFLLVIQPDTSKILVPGAKAPRIESYQSTSPCNKPFIFTSAPPKYSNLQASFPQKKSKEKKGGLPREKETDIDLASTSVCMYYKLGTQPIQSTPSHRGLVIIMQWSIRPLGIGRCDEHRSIVGQSTPECAMAVTKIRDSQN